VIEAGYRRNKSKRSYIQETKFCFSQKAKSRSLQPSHTEAFTNGKLSAYRIERDLSFKPKRRPSSKALSLARSLEWHLERKRLQILVIRDIGIDALPNDLSPLRTIRLFPAFVFFLDGLRFLSLGETQVSSDIHSRSFITASHRWRTKGRVYNSRVSNP
jgi:hypothetical protein